MLRPQGTRDPEQYPLGYAALDGCESVEVAYELVKDGHFICAQRTLSSAYHAFQGIHKLILAEYPLETISDLAVLSARKKELLGRVLVKRSFWEYDDYADNEFYRSFGPQNQLFDNYSWNHELHRVFLLHAEKWVPVSENTHLTFDEYTKLMINFFAVRKGLSVAPVLPRCDKLHPAYGVFVPTKGLRGPIVLYQKWLENFKAPLMLNKALVVRCGCGVVGFATRQRGVSMVRCTDSSPLAVEAARADAVKLGFRYRHMSFVVSEMFPVVDGRNAKKNLYDLIVYNPDAKIYSGIAFDHGYDFAPGLSGMAADLESFFESAQQYLNPHGVVAIVTTNIYSIFQPGTPHPIEYEVKVNRRWLILDYFDVPIQKPAAADVNRAPQALKDLGAVGAKLRGELWVLHPLDSLPQFAWLHGVPGAEKPAIAARFGRRALQSQRTKMMQNHVQMMGGDWGAYKARMLQMLQENVTEEEDDVAEAVRMAMDPTYPMHLARKAAKVIEQGQVEKEEFHRKVAALYPSRSPRAVFDDWATGVRVDLEAEKKKKYLLVKQPQRSA